MIWEFYIKWIVAILMKRLFEFDFLTIPEYREQFKMFRLNDVFLVGKTIKITLTVKCMELFDIIVLE